MRGLQRVLADVDQHRAGAARRGDVERLGDRARDLRRVGDQVVVLGDRHRDAADVGLLEGVRADRGRRDLAGDGHDRHRVHVGVGDRRDQVGGARAARGHADADLAGGRRVALGRVAGALLVADEDVPDLGGVHQRVVRRQDRAAGDAEDGVDPDALERPDQALRPGDLDRAGGPYRRREVGRRRVLGAGAPRRRGWPCGLAVRHCRHRFRVRSVPVVGPWSGPGRRVADLGDEKTPRPGVGQEGQRTGSAGACALGKYEDSGHEVTVLQGRSRCQPATRPVSPYGQHVRAVGRGPR